MKVLIFLMVICVMLASAPAYGATQQAQANMIVRSLQSPNISPGGQGSLTITLFNPYNQTMQQSHLTLSIYSFSSSTVHKGMSSIPPDSRPYFVNTGGQNATFTFTLVSGGVERFTLLIQTNYSTPHGTFFSQAVYTVSLYLSFLINGTHIRMGSKGVFTASEWNSIFPPDPAGGSYMNYTYLNRTLGYAGILPDISFGVNTASPLYLFIASGSLAAFFAVVAFVSYSRHAKRRKPSG